MNETVAPPLETVNVDLTRDELELVRAALRLLLSTLGHEEAEELHEVRALIERLPSA
jgi:Arc/MetJ-type ribon-helix-helix transcriptional regulator